MHLRDATRSWLRLGASRWWLRHHAKARRVAPTPSRPDPVEARAVRALHGDCGGSVGGPLVEHGRGVGTG